ncbi:MAG: NAD(P)-dependent oxidoreductase [Erysipelotrichaceae bacterium]
MNILYCRLQPLTESQLQNIRDLGYHIDVIDHEFDDITDYERYEIVVGYQVFRYHEIELFKNLKTILLFSAGMDHLDHAYLQQHNIRVINAEDVYAPTMAEWIIGKMLEQLHEFPTFYEQQRQHVWKQHLDLQSLAHKQVLVIGFGNIAKALVKRLVAFDAKVTIVNRTASQGVLDFQSLDQELATADIVVVAIALSEETYHLMDQRRIDLMKEGALFINVARGGIVDEPALLYRLRKNTLSAHLDVFEHEPLDSEHPIWNLANVSITPHNSYASDLSKERMIAHLMKWFASIAQEG